MDGWLRCLGGAVGFGFAAVWITASLAAAFVCLGSAALGCGAVLVVEHARARRAGNAASHDNPATRRLALPTSGVEEDDLPLRADELNHDLGHVYQPPAGPEYGWPANDDTAT